MYVLFIYTYLYQFKRKITKTIFRSSGKSLLYSLQDVISDKFNRLIYNYLIRICCHDGI